MSVHAVSTGAEELALDAYEAALGPAGPNPLHHRSSSNRGERRAAGAHGRHGRGHGHPPDGSAVDWVLWDEYMGLGRRPPRRAIGWLSRWRDFVEAGLHVAAATDMPWISPDSPDAALTEGIGRPWTR